MTGLSPWWPTPARAVDHFDAIDLARSESINRPLRRTGLLTAVAKAALLVAAAMFGAGLSDRAGIPRLTDVTGWWEAAVSARVALGAALTVVALRLPEAIADAWFEYRFSPGIEDHQPVPVPVYGATVLVLGLGSWLLLTVTVGLGYRLAVETDAWPLVAAGAIVLLALTMALTERYARRLPANRERPLEADRPAAVELAELAARLSLPGLRFNRDPQIGADRTGAGRPGLGSNAAAVGVGVHRRVVVTDGLLARDRRTRDFVVAHELTHLARHHVAARAAVAVAASLASIGVLAGLVELGWPWSLFGLDPLDPLGLPMPALVLSAVTLVTGPVIGWISRAQERVADAGAVAAVGPISAAEARNLYLGTTADLQPPRWLAPFRHHPAPAERLEYLARSRRTADRDPARFGENP